MVYTMPPANLTNESRGLENFVVWEIGQVNIIPTGILFFIFFVIFAGGYITQKKQTGHGNAPMWAAVGSLVTTSLSFVLFLYDGLVGVEVVSISTILCIFFSGWFLLAGRDD